MCSACGESHCGCAIVGGPESYAAIKLPHSGDTQLCRVPEGMTVECGQYVVVPSRYGRDLGRVIGTVAQANLESWGEAQSVHRIAVAEDIERDRANAERARHALSVCRERVARRGLPMNLVDAHFVLDEPRLVFFFTSETRVDFRDLVKDLVAEFRTRIELRQIGVRDETRILGGLAVCGRVLCCNGISDRLKPVSIKMAKAQNLSLNSMKISGPCGRLLCCLEYEYDYYREEKRGLPSEGTRIRYDETTFTITEVNVITRTIRMEGDGRVLEIPAGRFHLDAESSRWAVGDPVVKSPAPGT